MVATVRLKLKNTRKMVKQPIGLQLKTLKSYEIRVQYNVIVRNRYDQLKEEDIRRNANVHSKGELISFARTFLAVYLHMVPD